MEMAWKFLILVCVCVSAEEFEPCGGKPADVFFLLDSSSSLTLMDFEKELNFTRDVAAMFDTSPGKVRVGVLSFSATVARQFGLGEYKSKADMLEKIRVVPYEGQGTNTGEALRFLHSKGLSSKIVRPGIPHIAIVLTDGMSQVREDTLEEAKKVHEAGITVFVIGIGVQVDSTELAAIGSQPTNNFVNTIKSFDALAYLKEALAIRACKVKPQMPEMQSEEAVIEQEIMATGGCTPRKPLDVVFSIDTAGIGAYNVKYVLDFIGNISDRLNMADADVSFATVTSGCVDPGLSEDAAYSNSAVKQGISNFVQPTHDHIMRGIRMRAADSRRGTNHIAVTFLTHRLPLADYWRSKREKKRADYQKVSVFVFGVGETYDEEQAKDLVADKGEFFTAPSFQSLGEMDRAFMYSLCLFGTK